MPMVREAAEARVHSMCFGYLDSGGDDEVILLYVIVIVIVIVIVRTLIHLPGYTG